MKTDDHASAAAYAGRALEIGEAAGNRAVVSLLEAAFVRLALRRGDVAAARSDLGASLGIAIAIGRPSLQLDGVSCFAEILAAQGETGCGRLVLDFVAGHPSVTAPERDAIRARLASGSGGARRRPGPASSSTSWSIGSSSSESLRRRR